MKNRIQNLPKEQMNHRKEFAFYPLKQWTPKWNEPSSWILKTIHWDNGGK